MQRVVSEFGERTVGHWSAPSLQSFHGASCDRSRSEVLLMGRPRVEPHARVTVTLDNFKMELAGGNEAYPNQLCLSFIGPAHDLPDPIGYW
jgi:hypothetical protein